MKQRRRRSTISTQKMFFPKIEKYWKVITISIIITFVLLFLFGYYLGPDKCMKPPVWKELDVETEKEK